MYHHGSSFVTDLKDMEAMIRVADDAQAPVESSLPLLPLSHESPQYLLSVQEYRIRHAISDSTVSSLLSEVSLHSQALKTPRRCGARHWLFLR